MLEAEPASVWVTVSGTRLHFLDWGGTGNTIVIYHATGLLGRVYAPFARAFRAIGHVISLDQRAHGGSGEAGQGGYGWPTLGTDLKGFLEAIGARNTFAFGHSAGATGIAALASDHPELIARAVLVEPVLFDSPGRSRPGQLAMGPQTRHRKTTFASVDEMFTRFAAKPPFSSWDPGMLRDYCEYGTRPNDNGERELICPRDSEAFYYENAHLYDGLGYLLRCTIPMLVIFGGARDAIGPHIANRLRRELTSAQVIELPQAGHFAPMEQPEEIARLACVFFTNS
ncbi:MAG: alpha/beta hydrolase [Candidatus Binataceae bacterium]|nr:alpha/beta hydrolase [Candidatus Binataceae bacterium]